MNIISKSQFSNTALLLILFGFCYPCIADEISPSPLPATEFSELNKVIMKFRENLIFHAPFNDSPLAILSEGKNEPASKNDIGYAQGKFGNALSNGTLRYDGKKNIDVRSGSAVFWMEICRETPSNTEGYFEPFVFMFDQGQYHFSKFDARNKAPTFFYFQSGATSKQAHNYASTLNWKKGDWHLVTCTWGPGFIRYSIDGDTYQENNTIPVNNADPGFVRFEIAAKSQPSLSIAIDEFMLFNHPLSQEEIKWIWETTGKAEARK